MSYSIGIDIGVASVGMAMVDENEKIFDLRTCCYYGSFYGRVRQSAP